MKVFKWALCGLLCAQPMMAGTSWMNVNYAGDKLNAHCLDVHLPDNQDDTHKVVVLIYGSAWMSNNSKEAAFKELGKPLLDAGFAVVTVNHRSSGDAVFPAQINDVKAAVRYVREHAAQFHLDTSFIGVTGYSSGGHLSALAGATNGVKTKKVGKVKMNIEGKVGDCLAQSSRVDAVVDWFGPIDMTRMDGCSKPKGEGSPEALLIGGNPADNLERLALISPLTYLDRKDPKVLVIHGTDDNVVPDCQSEFFAEALKKKGLLADFVRVPGGHHGPITFNADTFKRMVDFFKEQAALKCAGKRK